MLQFVGCLCGLWSTPNNYKNLLYIKKITLQLNKGIVSVAAGSANKDKKMQLRKLPNAHYFNPGEKCLLPLGISESTKYFVVIKVLNVVVIKQVVLDWWCL